MKKLRFGAWLTLFAFSAAACQHRSKLTAWTTGEPNAPADVAAVYSAVLDEIFPSGPNGPTLVVINQMTEASWVEIDPKAKKPYRRPDAVIAPFRYRIPITFADTASLRDLYEKTRKADSMSYTAPMTDLLYRQRAYAPFIARYPGAWGKLTLGRVGFGADLSYALVDVRYGSVAPQGDSGHELFRLARTNNVWKVVARIPREGPIKAEPIPYRMLHAWVDSSLFPAPRRRLVRGTVKDSASGRPLRRISFRLRAL